MKIKGNDQYSFSQVPKVQVPRSSFNRSHGYKTTFESGYLIPIYVDEALPGDTFALSLSAFARLATPIVPAMDNLYMDFFFFAVPNRLLWSNWQRFMGEQESPDDTTDFLLPQVDLDVTGNGYESIYDYMGIPPQIAGLKPNALPFRAYNLIWNEWFRDQNLQDPAVVAKSDGPDNPDNYFCRRRGKRHDYFTSCLPWPQKGDAVEIPIGGFAPVVGDGQIPNMVPYSAQGVIPSALSITTNSATEAIRVDSGQLGWVPGNLTWAPDRTGLQADLSTATATTINSLRQAFQLQRLLEKDARGGTRYTEILRAHFGVTSPDARLQRPEYLGGGSTPIVYNPVTQTSGTANDPTTGYTPNPQGNLAAFAVAGARGIGFTKSFTEHCTVIGLVQVRADLTYQQGMNRMWNRREKYDFYWPALSHLGEQAVLQKEIFATGTAADDVVFGYQERWAEYRYSPSIITGKFRSSYPQSLDIWHFAQDFANAPVLSDIFIQDRPEVKRTLAVQDEAEFIFDCHFNIRAVRPMPVYSVPGFIDHF